MLITQDPEPSVPAPQKSAAGVGLAMGLGAYLSWGVIPLYFRLVRHVPAVDVVAHRVVWSVLFLSILLSLTGGWGTARAALRSRATLLSLCGSSVLIAINWVVFVWAVEHGQVLQASLGYFINPLVSVLLGMTFLKERLRPGQYASLALAAAGVAVLTIALGRLPWVALTLAVSFGVYGLLRKTVSVGPLVGLSMETALLAPLALAYVIFSGHTTQMSGNTHVVLALAGPVTALPLLMFAAGARRLRLTTMGFLQYLAPTCQFLLAVFAFGEPFTKTQAISFSMIWAALLLYSIDSLVSYRNRPRDEVAAAAPAGVAIET